MVERVIVGPWKTNCYIFSSTKKECIIIDPGGDETEIASRVDVLNMVPVGIALTHGHVDHLAALGRLRANYASRGYILPIGISPSDRKFLGSGALEAHKESLKAHEIDEVAFFVGDTPELPKADVRLREGDRVFDMDLVVLETPGHTPGSLCFYSEREGVLFSGDTLFFDGVGRTDLPGGSDRKLRDSIQKKIAVLPPETRVFPGHGPFTTVERERRGNPFFREPLPELKRVEPAKPARRRQAPAKKPAARARVVRAKPARPLKARAASGAAAAKARGAKRATASRPVKAAKTLQHGFSKNGRPAAKAPARARSAAARKTRVTARKAGGRAPAARASARPARKKGR